MSFKIGSMHAFMASIYLYAAPTEAVSLFRDDFSGTSLNTSAWTVGTNTIDRTQFGQSPTISSNVVTLKVDTYHPLQPGNALWGTQIQTNQAFSPNVNGVQFEARVRNLSPFVPGLVSSVFTYQYWSTGGQTYADEIDFEFLSTQVGSSTNSPVLVTTWRNYNVSGSNFNDINAHNSAYASLPPGTPDVTLYHVYSFQWFPDRVKWFIDGNLVRETTQAVPTHAMPLFMNFWAPNSGWGDAYGAALVPTSNPANNRQYLYQVDYVEVSILPEPTTGLLILGGMFAGLQRRRIRNQVDSIRNTLR